MTNAVRVSIILNKLINNHCDEDESKFVKSSLESWCQRLKAPSEFKFMKHIGATFNKVGN